MIRSKLAVFVVALVLCGVWAGPAKSQTLYGITWSAPGQLITINTTTAAPTVVGPLAALMTPAGLAFRGAQLYTYDGSAGRMFELNPATGATLANLNIGAVGSGEGDLAFRPSDNMGFLSLFAPDFFRVDVTVPNSTRLPPLNPTMDGLAFSGAGVLYGVSEGGSALYTINTTTSVATLVGNTGVSGASSAGLSFDASGTLFASINNFTLSRLYRINTTTGAATLVGTIMASAEITGIAFQGGAVVPPNPPGGGNEGSFDGSGGPNGSEGSFGFGGRVFGSSLARSFPVLRGPFPEPPDSAKNLSVYNVSQAQAMSTDSASARGLAWGGNGVLLLGTVVLGVGVGLLLVVLRK